MCGHVPFDDCIMELVCVTQVTKISANEYLKSLCISCVCQNMNVCQVLFDINSFAFTNIFFKAKFDNLGK